MLEILTVMIFIWLMVKAVGLAVRLTWGAAKVMAGLLMILALPALVICVLFVGGLALLLPVVLIAVAFGILKLCAL